jgi:hypothetical protein
MYAAVFVERGVAFEVDSEHQEAVSDPLLDAAIVELGELGLALSVDVFHGPNFGGTKGSIPSSTRLVTQRIANAGDRAAGPTEALVLFGSKRRVVGGYRPVGAGETFR